MTNEEIERLEGIDLARACAKATGNPSAIADVDFRPDADYAHAAELRAWATNAFFGVCWRVSSDTAGAVDVAFFRYIGGQEKVLAKWRDFDECVATCKAFLALREVMGGAK